MGEVLKNSEPLFKADEYSAEERYNLAPFFTNLDKPVYVPLLSAPELIGALCSRTSRAADDLRKIYLNEYVLPFLNPERGIKENDQAWEAKQQYGNSLREFIDFLHKHSITDLFANPQARSFYVKWLAQYGDDSIAQMAGTHLVFSGLSQVAIKHLEDQRIGLAPIEKSTRYVNYSDKVNGQYKYYVDPNFEKLGLLTEYREAMDGLFDTYTALLPRLTEWLKNQFPEEKESVVEKKAFDVLRGLLPTSTLSQVAFFGNGQAFEYMVSRSGHHPLAEVRWAAEAAYDELSQIVPAFLRRLKDEEKTELITEYQQYLAQKPARVSRFAKAVSPTPSNEERDDVQLTEYDMDGEAKIVAGILYNAEGAELSWNEYLAEAIRMTADQKREVLDAYLAGRTARWQKVGRAFENAYVRFDILMNIGGWRDLHRHRMHTQQRQLFSCRLGYDVPVEIAEAGMETEFRSAIDKVDRLYDKVVSIDPQLAQYVVTLAHKVRFTQYQNMREVFWEVELRTIPEGHPDYRVIEQKKFKLIETVYPLLAERMMVNMGQYDFARRGQEERIQEKLRKMMA